MAKTPSALYGGLDFHKDNTYCALIDTGRNPVFERRLPNTLDSILKALEPYQQRIKTLVVESTFNWYWLVDGLRDHGYDTRLANPARMQENIGLKHANDKTDARFIANQLLLGCLPEGYIYPKETRGVKALANKLSKACYFILRERKPFDLQHLIGGNVQN